MRGFFVDAGQMVGFWTELLISKGENNEKTTNNINGFAT